LRRGNKKPLLFFIIFIVIAVSLIIASARNRANVGILDNIVNFTVNPIANAFNGIGRSVGGFFQHFGDVKKLAQEVDSLKYKNSMLEQKINSMSSLENENDRFRKLLELKEKYPQFGTTAATVMAKDGGNYCRFITIDKGSESGIIVNQPVIANDGLVGIVFEVGRGWSKIQTILDPSTSAGCRITRTGDISVTEGDVSLVNSGCLKMLYVSKQFTISDGDIIETSGLGEIYPRGIPIGRVKEVKTSENDNTQYAVITPSVDFSNIFEVLVIVER